MTQLDLTPDKKPVDSYGTEIPLDLYNGMSDFLHAHGLSWWSQGPNVRWRYAAMYGVQWLIVSNDDACIELKSRPDVKRVRLQYDIDPENDRATFQYRTSALEYYDLEIPQRILGAFEVLVGAA